MQRLYIMSILPMRVDVDNIQIFKFEKIQITINKPGNLIQISKRSFLARLQYKNMTLL